MAEFNQKKSRYGRVVEEWPSPNAGRILWELNLFCDFLTQEFEDEFRSPAWSPTGEGSIFIDQVFRPLMEAHASIQARVGREWLVESYREANEVQGELRRLVTPFVGRVGVADVMDSLISRARERLVESRPWGVWGCGVWAFGCLKGICDDGYFPLIFKCQAPLRTGPLIDIPRRCGKYFPRAYVNLDRYCSDECRDAFDKERRYKAMEAQRRLERRKKEERQERKKEHEAIRRLERNSLQEKCIPI